MAMQVRGEEAMGHVETFSVTVSFTRLEDFTIRQGS
jgi:hypothetical protein